MSLLHHKIDKKRTHRSSYMTISILFGFALRLLISEVLYETREGMQAYACTCAEIWKKSLCSRDLQQSVNAVSSHTCSLDDVCCQILLSHFIAPNYPFWRSLQAQNEIKHFIKKSAKFFINWYHYLQDSCSANLAEIIIIFFNYKRGSSSPNLKNISESQQ